MLKLSNKDIGYIAGLIDGEGTICLGKCTWKHRKLAYYRPFIKIANSNLEMLIWVKNKLRTGTIKKERDSKNGWKAMYIIYFSANMIRKFLPLIIDSLIIKKKQALLITEFLEFSNARSPQNFRMNNEELYVYYYNSIKQLNRRGVQETSDELLETPTSSAGDNQQPSSQSEKVQRLPECSDTLNNRLRASDTKVMI